MFVCLKCFKLVSCYEEKNGLSSNILHTLHIVVHLKIQYGEKLYDILLFVLFFGFMVFLAALY